MIDRSFISRYQLTKGSIPIIGVGGISNSEDVLEYLLAGASAVEVGAMNFKDPYICKKIIEDLPETLKKYGYTSIQEVIGRRLKWVEQLLL